MMDENSRTSLQSVLKMAALKAKYGKFATNEVLAKFDPPFSDEEKARGSAELEEILVVVFKWIMEKRNPRVLNILESIVGELADCRSTVEEILIRTKLNPDAVFRWMELLINAQKERAEKIAAGEPVESPENAGCTVPISKISSDCDCMVCQVVKEFSPPDKSTIPTPSNN